MDRKIEWFGADVEENPAANRTAVYIDGFKGVDATVIRPRRMEDGSVQDVSVRRAAPRVMQAKTTAGAKAGHDIGKLTARFKTFREAARFSPLADKEMWEKRRDIAFAEMEWARMQQKLDNYLARGGERPEQVKVLKDTINQWRGRFFELTGQA